MSNRLQPCFWGFVWLGFFGAVPIAIAQTDPMPAPVPNAAGARRGIKMLDGQKVYNYVEKMPLYLDGGKPGLQAAITKHVRGGAASGSRAFVSFIVDRQGNVRNLTFAGESATDTASVDPALAEALAAIGKFRPGTQNGKPVNVELMMPVVKRPSK